MTDDRKIRLEQTRRFMEALPHCRALNITLTNVEDGIACMSMPYDKKLIGDPATGVIHGGAVSTLMDTCGGTAVIAHPDGPSTTATLDLRIDYMRAATPGQTIVAKATCYHITRSIAFVRAVAMDDDTENPVATAAGAFTVQSQT